MSDEALLEKYDSGKEIYNQDIIQAIEKRKIFPCMFGSALRLQGCSEFLDRLDSFTRMPDYSSEFSARVYKISEDKQGSRLTFMKITGGVLKIRDQVVTDPSLPPEKVTELRLTTM